jgi:hypothetical protein
VGYRGILTGCSGIYRVRFGMLITQLEKFLNDKNSAEIYGNIRTPAAGNEITEDLSEPLFNFNKSL